jgi:hypothetical protein
MNQYSTTKKGQFHAQEPYYYQRRKQERIQSRVSAILNDDEQFSQAVDEEVKTRLSEIESGVREAPQIIESVTNTDDSALRQELNEKNSKIQELEAQVQHLLLHKSNVATNPKPQEKTPEEQKAESERRKRREQLAMDYRGRYLDSDFFVRWGDMRPYKMKHLQLFRKGSVEILSKSNPEHSRGHTRRILYSQEVLGAKLYIIKMHKNGINIVGRGLLSDKVLLRW